MDLFRAGDGDYHTYRIPALVVTTAGNVLAFCEGRREGSGDAGSIDLLLRRQVGDRWSDPTVVASDPPNTVGNPCPVVDRDSSRIHLLHTRNPGEVTEDRILRGETVRTVWSMHSDDDGVTWSTPREITSEVSRPGWTWYATGPCHGIQSVTGRLVAPCDHHDGSTYHSHVITSDDGGDHWHVGGIMPPGSNESTVANGLYINCRNQDGGHRIVGWSADDGDSFGLTRVDTTLVDPVCQGSTLRLGDGRLLFANPAGGGRSALTVRVSGDDGQTWIVTDVVHEGPSAYSDLCALPDGQVGLFYECGDASPYERLVYATAAY